MMDKNALNLQITIDTIYGFINKYAACNVSKINNKEILKQYLKRVFTSVEIAILQDFETLEKANNVEVENE